MSYVDDWGQTAPDDRARLEQVCENPTCTHWRYLHGDARTVRNGPYRWIEHKPGTCTSCSCVSFMGEPPITRDDVLDVAVALRYDVHLEDIGIKPWTEERCPQLTIRHTGAGQLSAQCKLEKNHSETEHDPDWNDLKG